MTKMGDVNFLVLNCVKNKMAKARNNNHAHVRLVDLATLKGAWASSIALSMRRAITRDAAAEFSWLI